MKLSQLFKSTRPIDPHTQITLKGEVMSRTTPTSPTDPQLTQIIDNVIANTQSAQAAAGIAIAKATKKKSAVKKVVKKKAVVKKAVAKKAVAKKAVSKKAAIKKSVNKKVAKKVAKKK